MARLKPPQLERIPGTTVAQARYQFNLAGQLITYTLKRSPRHHGITLTIDENGLRVRAPWHASLSHIELLLASHARWITRKLVEWQARKLPPFTWQAGASIMLLGQPLKLAPTPECRITKRDGDYLYIATDTNDPDTLAKHVVAWLRSAAQDWLTQRTVHYAPVLGVHMPIIRLSNARKRWGSCHPRGRIRLNWRLIQMPLELIDYVVVHELAHLHEANHSPRFWHRVADVLPDYNLRRKTLRREGHRYLIA